MFAERVTLTQLRRLAELNVRRRLVNVMNMYPPTLVLATPTWSTLAALTTLRSNSSQGSAVCWLIFIGYCHTPSRILDDFRWVLITVDSSIAVRPRSRDALLRRWHNPKRCYRITLPRGTTVFVQRNEKHWPRRARSHPPKTSQYTVTRDDGRTIVFDKRNTGNSSVNEK